MASSGTDVAAVGLATAAAFSFGFAMDASRKKGIIQEEQALNAQLRSDLQSQEEKVRALSRAVDEEAPDNSRDSVISALSEQIMKHEADKASAMTTFSRLYQNEADLKAELEAERMRAEEAATSMEAAHAAELGRLTSLLHETQTELSAANELLATNEKDLSDATSEGAALKARVESDGKIKDSLSSDLALQTKEAEALRVALREANEASTKALERARENAGIVEDASRAIAQQMSKEHAEAMSELEGAHTRELEMKTALHAAEAKSIRDAASRQAEKVASAHRSIVDELTREVGRLCSAAATTVGDNATVKKDHVLYQEVVLALNKTKAELRTSRNTQDRIKLNCELAIAENSNELTKQVAATEALKEELKAMELKLAIASQASTKIEEQADLRLQVESANRIAAEQSDLARDAGRARAAAREEAEKQSIALDAAQRSCDDLRKRLLQADAAATAKVAAAAAEVQEQRRVLLVTKSELARAQSNENHASQEGATCAEQLAAARAQILRLSGESSSGNVSRGGGTDMASNEEENSFIAAERDRLARALEGASAAAATATRAHDEEKQRLKTQLDEARSTFDVRRRYLEQDCEAAKNAAKMARMEADASAEEARAARSQAQSAEAARATPPAVREEVRELVRALGETSEKLKAERALHAGLAAKHEHDFEKLSDFENNDLVMRVELSDMRQANESLEAELSARESEITMLRAVSGDATVACARAPASFENPRFKISSSCSYMRRSAHSVQPQRNGHSVRS